MEWWIALMSAGFLGGGGLLGWAKFWREGKSWRQRVEERLEKNDDDHEKLYQVTAGLKKDVDRIHKNQAEMKGMLKILTAWVNKEDRK